MIQEEGNGPKATPPAETLPIGKDPSDKNSPSGNIAAKASPSFPVLGVLFFGILGGILGGAGLFISYPYWSHFIDPALLDLDSRTAREKAEQTLSERLDAIEKANSENGVTLSFNKNAIDESLAKTQEQLNVLAKEITDLQQSAAALLANPPQENNAQQNDTGNEMPSVMPDALSMALESRMQKLETSLGELALRIASAPADESDLRQQLDTALPLLQGHVEELSKKIAAIESELQTIPDETHRQQAAALIVAIGQLQSFLADDRPFSGPLQLVEKLAASESAMQKSLQPAIDNLLPYADSGAPTRSQLVAGFPARDIARTAEAELASDVTGDAPWWKRSIDKIAEWISFRPIGSDVEGDAPLDRLARGEALLQEGDLSGALAEIAAIEGDAAKPAAAWVESAKARLKIEEAATLLSGISAQALAPHPNANPDSSTP